MKLKYDVGKRLIYYDNIIKSYEYAYVIQIRIKNSLITSNNLDSFYDYKITNKYGIKWIKYE